MNLVVYRPEHFELLRRAVAGAGPDCTLGHRPFVDYYYATRDWCKLYLFLDDAGTVAGTVGLEQLHFEHTGRDFPLGFPSNYYAFQHGAGGHLFLHWMKSCRTALVFGGSEDTHRILRQQQWTYYAGVKVFLLNRAYPSFPGEARWKTAAKWARGLFRPRLTSYARSVPAGMASTLTVQEERTFTDDLLPHSSPFAFRFAPTREYLAWRYDTGLSFVRYRLFRILSRGASAGYVILNEFPDRLLVAQCDAEEPATLAWGVVLSIVAASREDRRAREVMLTCSHPAMQEIYQRFGFRAARQERPFVLGSLRHRAELPPPDTSAWLINFDWGDNGLRVPFLDQVGSATPGANH
jgi:hypothetical protein